MSPKEELYNLKNKSCQEKFREYTNTTSMKRIFDSDKNINILAKKFLKSLNGAIIKCFKKIRNTKSRDVKLVELYTKRNVLKDHIKENHDESIINIEQRISEEASEIDQETAGLDCETGGYNAGHLWKLKSKIIPKPNQVPTAMKLNDGTLLTGNEEIKSNT